MRAVQISLLVVQTLASLCLAFMPSNDSLCLRLPKKHWQSVGLILSGFALLLAVGATIQSDSATREAMNQLTGADSFGFVLPTCNDTNTPERTQCALIVLNEGKYPLYAVHLDISQTSYVDGKYYSREVNIGDIAPYGSRTTSLSDGIEIRKGVSSNFQVIIAARNRTVTELVDIPKSSSAQNRNVHYRLIDSNSKLIPVSEIKNPSGFSAAFFF